jgi:hypothetical protein
MKGGTMNDTVKTVLGTLAVIAFIVFWMWPRSYWVNEWDAGSCLAWRMTDYGSFFTTSKGPYVVDSYWCG